MKLDEINKQVYQLMLIGLFYFIKNYANPRTFLEWYTTI